MLHTRTRTRTRTRPARHGAAGIALAFTTALALTAGCSDNSGSEAATTGAPSTAGTTAEPGTTAAPTTTEPATTAATDVPTTSAPAPEYAATIDELLTLGRPIVLAHTAGEDEFPASTLFAFGESVKAGVDMLDLNVLLTADDQLLVQHDDTVDRNTSGTGAVADLSYDQISPLDAGYWFTSACSDCHDRPDDEYLYRGIRTGAVPPPDGYTADDFALPTLTMLIERFPTIPLNIEIKGSGDAAKAAADVLAEVLRDTDRAQAAVVASFDDEIVSYFHSIAPDIEVSPGLGVLTAFVLDGTPVPDGMRILQLPPEYGGLTVISPELIERCASAGYVIWVWPNDRDLENLAAYRSFLDQGIHGLNINFPAQGVQAIEEYLAAQG